METCEMFIFHTTQQTKQRSMTSSTNECKRRLFLMSHHKKL